jgi:VanZ family protein
LINLPPKKQIPLNWLIVLSVVLPLLMLAEGLNPGGYRFVNNVKWIGERSGIQFGRFGIAYTSPIDEGTLAHISGADGFSIEVALRPVSYHQRKYGFICAFHNGNDSDQLVMGQWRSQLIVMNGDDYAYRKKIKRISVDLASPFPAERFVTITSGKGGTQIYIDGKSGRTRKNFTLKIPLGEEVSLLLGNSVYGKHPWSGDVYGLAVYDYQLSSEEVASHFSHWSKDKIFAFAGNENASVLYLFDEKGGAKAYDHASGRNHLEIPSRMTPLKRKILALPSSEFMSHINSELDIILNLLGFIPLGFVLFAGLSRSGGYFNDHPVISTALLCFLFSLLIETLQAWIPSRTSSILDLALNTIGGLSGAIICMVLEKGSRLFGRTV